MTAQLQTKLIKNKLIKNKPSLETHQIPSRAGELEVSSAWYDDASVNTLALICHPHPLYGGTMDNKVVTTVARTCIAQGMHTVRFNFRGTGNSTGKHDHGVGEVDDAQAVLNWSLAYAKQKGLAVTHLWLAGFSFGGFVAAKLATRLAEDADGIKLDKLTLIAPAVGSIDDRSYDTSALALPKNTHVIYGSADEVVPPSAMADFAQRYKLTQTILADASHFFHGRLTELRQFL